MGEECQGGGGLRRCGGGKDSTGMARMRGENSWDARTGCPCPCAAAGGWLAPSASAPATPGAPALPLGQPHWALRSGLAI